MILTYLIALMGIQTSPAFSMLALASRRPAFAAQQVWVSALVMGLILMVFTVIQGIGGHFLGADQSFLAAHPDLVHPMIEDGLQNRDLLVPELIRLVGETMPWLMGLLAIAALAAMKSTASCYMAVSYTHLDVYKRQVLGLLHRLGGDGRTKRTGRYRLFPRRSPVIDAAIYAGNNRYQFFRLDFYWLSRPDLYLSLITI